MTSSTAAGSPDLDAEDRRLLAEAAEAIVRARMAVPAMLLLETLTPLNVVLSSALRGLEPLLSVALPRERVERLARLLERRQAIPAFIALIDEAEARRRSAR